MLCWTARLVTLIARVYFVFKVVYASSHCTWSPDTCRYYLCKQHQTERRISKCCRVLLWRFRLRRPRPSVGQCRKTRGNDPKLQAKLGPCPSQTSQGLNIFWFYICTLTLHFLPLESIQG